MAKHSKARLPQKICKTCAKPFAWRKKWARDWDQVLYCSERCRRSKSEVLGCIESGVEANMSKRGSHA
ncbi:MAG: DUF2256 domain-containing protein [Pseudomonadales bacterium]|nr:DUF2256 domain-containing protein [Pseudomonadales bacterium]